MYIYNSHIKFTILANQRLIIVKYGKLSWIELEQIQTNVSGTNGITTAPYGKTLSPSNKLMTIKHQLLKQLYKNSQ